MVARYTAILPAPMKATSKIRDAATAKMRDWAGRTQAGIAKYPMQRSRTYRRTGRLGRGWTYRYGMNGGDLEAIVENKVEYAPYVQGEDQTSLMHVYGWKTVDEVGQKEWKSTLAELADILAKVE